jgi:hypothetical protein
LVTELSSIANSYRNEVRRSQTHNDGSLNVAHLQEPSENRLGENDLVGVGAHRSGAALAIELVASARLY